MIDREEISKIYQVQYMDGDKLCISTCSEDVLIHCLDELMMDKCTILKVILQ